MFGDRRSPVFLPPLSTPMIMCVLSMHSTQQNHAKELCCSTTGACIHSFLCTHTNICTHTQLNASDDRGIGIVRGAILNFASTRTIFKSGFKLIILDEADAMTNDAQNALRRGIYIYTSDLTVQSIRHYSGVVKCKDSVLHGKVSLWMGLHYNSYYAGPLRVN